MVTETRPSDEFNEALSSSIPVKERRLMTILTTFCWIDGQICSHVGVNLKFYVVLWLQYKACVLGNFCKGISDGPTDEWADTATHSDARMHL